MLTFARSVVINAPVDAVWAFHQRPDVLKILTPPWQPVQVLRREGGVGVGAESEFRLWLGLLPIPWVARHVECEPPFLFVDRQQRGPMAYWLHRHELEPLETATGMQTRLTDRINYALPGGALPGGAIAEALLEPWVNARLSDMFAYRHRATRIACERCQS